MIDALRVALGEGVTYFDTAADYGDGTSERIFGEALEGTGAEIVVATKVSNHMSVRASVERSLRNLRRDHIDIIQIHGTAFDEAQVESILAPGGMLDEMLALREEGLVRHVGFTSEANNLAVDRFIADGRFEIVQIAYNFLFQHPYDPVRPFGSIIDADSQGMGIVTMRTLTSGLLQKWIRQVNPEDTYDYAPALLQFVLSNPLVDVALVGMRTSDEVYANIRTCRDLSARIDFDKLYARFV